MLQWIQKQDQRFLDYISNHGRKPWLTMFMKIVTTSGNGGCIWFLLVFFLFFCREYKAALTLLLSLAIFLLFGNIFLKNLIRRKRPSRKRNEKSLLSMPNEFSFPSGHAYSSFAAAVVLFCYYDVMAIPAVILSIVIAFSRVYLCVHYPSDVICSFFLGVGTAILSFFIV